MSVLNKKKYLFWGCALLIWVVVIVGTLESKGYQPQKSRHFTEEEMVKIAISRAIQKMLIDPPKCVPVLGEDGSIKNLVKPDFIVPYRDVEHFLAENPNCCKIEKKFGLIVINVDGKVFYKDKFGQTHVGISSYKDRDGINVSFGTGWIHSQYFPSRIRYLP